MEKKFWAYFSFGYLLVNTLSVLVLIETIVFDRPYISLFILCFLLTFLINKKT